MSGHSSMCPDDIYIYMGPTGVPTRHLSVYVPLAYIPGFWGPYHACLIGWGSRR